MEMEKALIETTIFDVVLASVRYDVTRYAYIYSSRHIKKLEVADVLHSIRRFGSCKLELRLVGGDWLGS